MLSRRGFLIGAGAALAAPSLVKAESARVLRFVPRSDLGILDPVWSSANITRNHGFLVYDTLFGLNAAYEPSPQMLSGYTMDDDGLTWRLMLRDGQTWHDGEKVLARDCVASIKRWGGRDTYGQALMEATNELSAPDDKTIVFRLKKPFSRLPNALGKSNSYLCAMMPERLASVGPSKQVTEIIGSGPFKFVASERVPGARVVYERFAAYKPREEGEPSRTAGPKKVYFDRVEWITMSDAGTAAAALQAGEVDWWDFPVVDLLPVLKSTPGLTTKILEKSGQISFFRPNHLVPPFNNPDIRRAMLMAFSQAEMMTALVGDDHSLWADRVGFFGPGTPLANEAGLDIMSKPRDFEGAKRAIKAAGYNGEPVAFLVATDFPALRTLSDVSADVLKKIGLNVDYQALDWGTVQQRRIKREDSPSKGGWSAFCSQWEGADILDPAGHNGLRANGRDGLPGWPMAPKLEQLRSDWFDAKSLADQKTIAGDIQRDAFVDVPYVPLGQNFQPTSFRSGLQGHIEAFPFSGTCVARDRLNS